MPGSLILQLVVAPDFFVHTLRANWIGVAIYLLQEHLRASGGFRNSFTQSHGISNTVMKAIQDLIPSPAAHNTSDPRMKELQEMEKRKSAIDEKAEQHVRRELFCGLACLVIQTAALMRLTFWELTWDVMEPICFYGMSIYFISKIWLLPKDLQRALVRRVFPEPVYH